MHKALPSTTLYYKACTNYFPVLLSTTKLAQSTSQCYCVLQSLHKLLPSTTLYCKACTKHFSVLLCTTKLAHFTSQYYFVLQSLHKALPSATVYYKACTNYFPVLLCTTKLAQNTFQYYFVLQRLHKALPSTTLYYKACTKHFPVPLCTTKLAQNTSQYYFVLQSLRKLLPSTTVTKQPWRSHYIVICRDWFAKHNRTTRTGVETCSSKTGSRRQSRKKTILKHFLKGFLKGKLLAPKLRKSADKSLSQPGCSHSNTIYNLQLQKPNSITQAAAAPSNIHAAIPMRSASTNSRNAYNYAHRNNHCCKTHRRNQTTPAAPLAHTRYFHRRLQPLYTEKHKVSCSGFLHTTHGMQHSCSHSNAICNHSFKKRIELRTQEQPLLQNT